jgi:hypothetical protein
MVRRLAPLRSSCQTTPKPFEPGAAATATLWCSTAGAPPRSWRALRLVPLVEVRTYTCIGARAVLLAL